MTPAHKDFFGRMPGQIKPSIEGVTRDLNRLLTKIYLLSEYIEMNHARNNEANGMDGMYLLLNDFADELSAIIDTMQEVQNEPA